MKQLTYKQKITVIKRSIKHIRKDYGYGFGAVCGSVYENSKVFIPNEHGMLFISQYLKFYFPEIIIALKAISEDKELYENWKLRNEYNPDSYMWERYTPFGRAIRIEFLQNIKAMLINEHQLGNI